MKLIKNLYLLFCICVAAAAAAGDLHRRFPDAAVILLHDRENTVYQSDGTSETRDSCRYRIMNYDGVLQMRTLNMHYNSTYGTLQLTGLSLIKNDGRTIKLDPEKCARTGIDPEQMQSRIYDPAQKCMTVNIPNLEAGDTIVVETLRRTLKPRIPGEWSDICVMQADFPILDYQYTVDAPAAKPLLAVAVKDEVKGTLSFRKTENNDRIVYSWHARNVPQAIPEPAMPPLYSCSQRILVSTVRSWQTISRWYDALCAPQLAKINTAMREKTAELTAGKKDDTAKINALFQFVSQQIRYTGITGEEQAPGYEPHAVSQTFDRRHGVCRDKAALLVAMLRLAEVEAYPVLFMSGTPKDADVPNIYFNHAVVAAVVNGKYVLMDPTFETTRELFPAYLAGDAYLVAKPEGDTLRTAPALPAEKNLLSVNTSAVLGKDNSLSGRISLDFTGTYDQMYRAAFSEWHPGEREDFFALQLQKAIPGAKIGKLAVIPENVRDMSTPLRVTIDFTAAGHTGNSGEIHFFAMPRFARTFGVLNTLYTMTGLQKRSFPLRAMPRAVKESIAISLPEKFSLIFLPEKTSLDVPGIFRFSFQNRHEKNLLTENFFYAVDSMVISPEKYPELKKSLAAADRAVKTLPLVRTSPDLRQENSILLEHDEKFIVDSPESWEHLTSVRRKILNYAGMKEHSEVRIPYLDGVDTVEISGSVTAPDGTKHTLASDELNRMDAPGATAMPRYPRQKIAVASFPNVVPGSIMEYTVRRQIRNRPWFAREVPVQDYTAALKRSVSFSGQAAGRAEFSGGTVKCQEKRSGQDAVFTFRHIPALVPEAGTPALEYFAPSVRAYGAFDPAALRSRILRRLQKKAVVTAEITRIAKKLAAGKTPADAIDAIRKYVAAFVREADYPFYHQWAGRFFAPEQTLKEGYGSSADRAILLAAMLDAVGIKSSFVLSTSGTVPVNTERSEWLYEYPELLLHLPENGGIFLNDLGLHGALGARRTAGSKMVYLSPQIPAMTAVHNDRIVIDGKISVGESGSGSVAVKYIYSGKYFEQEAERFAKFTPELRRRHFQNLAAALSPAAEIVAADTSVQGGFFEVKMLLEIPGFAVRQGKYISCGLPGYDIFRKAASGITPQKRELPFMLSACDISCSYRITVPEKWQFLPSGEPAAFAGTTMLPDRRTLLWRAGISRSKQLLSPAEYAAEAENAGYINRAESGKILFITE